MKIDALKLLDGHITVDVDESVRALDVEDDPVFQFVEGMTGRVEFSRMTDKVLARGRVRTRVQTHCVRCLDPIELPLEADITLVYVHDPDLLDETKRMEFPEEMVYFDGHVIEPLADFREVLLLELPAYPNCDLVPEKVCGRAGLRSGSLSFGSSEPTESAPPAGGPPDSGAKSDWKATLRRVSLRNRKPGQD